MKLVKNVSAICPHLNGQDYDCDLIHLKKLINCYPKSKGRPCLLLLYLLSGEKDFLQLDMMYSHPIQLHYLTISNEAEARLSASANSNFYFY